MGFVLLSFCSFGFICICTYIYGYRGGSKGECLWNYDIGFYIYIIIGNHGDLSIKEIDSIHWLMRWRLILIENAGVSVTNDVDCQNYNRYYSPSYNNTTTYSIR